MKTGFLFFILLSIFVAVSCLSDMPDSISFDVTLNTSLAFPLGETSLGLNEVSGFDESLLETNPITGDPYWVEYEEVNLSYSIPFDIGDIYQTAEEIVQLTFRLNMYNGFPNEMQVQLYFIDAYGNTVDELFQGGPIVLSPATANDSGKITSKPHKKEDVSFTSNRIEALQEVNRIMVYIVFYTDDTDDELVKYYGEYFVDVQIGVKTTLKFDL